MDSHHRPRAARLLMLVAALLLGTHARASDTEAWICKATACPPTDSR